MGRRKLRFDLRKNYERKKYGLQVKIPLELLKPSNLIVQLLISAYSAPVPTMLRSRLGATQLLPMGWTVAEEGTQPQLGICPPLVIYKPHVVQVLAAPCVLFTLSVDDQFTWTLRLGMSEVSPENCQALRGFQPTLRSIKEVLQILSRIDECAFCVGSLNDKFMELVDTHNGTFKDPSGMYVHVTF